MSYSSLELDRENGGNGNNGGGTVMTPVIPRRRRSSATNHSDSDVSTSAHEQLKDYVYKKVRHI